VADRVLVCRCEDVTRKEVEDAVALGHRDLESVKRYTGFGTGWCQGKQCTAACARLLVQLGGEVPEVPITPRPPFHPVRLGHLSEVLVGPHDRAHPEEPER
jgi:bacterioferritin-associated ferredoxin